MRDQVMLFTKNLKNARLKKKLFYKFIDFFKIEDVVDTQIYRLRLLDKWRIHFVFHVFLLELYYKNENIALSSKMILIKKNEEWEVKKILNHDKKWEKFYYLIRWKNFSSCENSWISERNLENAQNIIKQYHKRQRNVVAILKTKKSRLKMRKKNFFEAKKNSIWQMTRWTCACKTYESKSLNEKQKKWKISNVIVLRRDFKDIDDFVVLIRHLLFLFSI